MWQENSDLPCDTGSDLKSIAADFPELDFSIVDPTFPNKAPGTPYAFARSANIARGASCLRKLYERPEKVIACVSHAGFLRTGISRRRYANADYRIFTFGTDAEGKLQLWEDDETEKEGGAMGRSDVGIYEIKDWDFPSENVVEIDENGA